MPCGKVVRTMVPNNDLDSRVLDELTGRDKPRALLVDAGFDPPIEAFSEANREWTRNVSRTIGDDDRTADLSSAGQSAHPPADFDLIAHPCVRCALLHNDHTAERLFFRDLERLGGAEMDFGEDREPFI